MTNPMPVNGRVSQRDLFEAIGALRSHMDHRFDGLESRVRAVETAQTSEHAQDEARRILLAEQREIRVEQGVSKRWLIGLAAGISVSIIISVVGFLR